MATRICSATVVICLCTCLPARAALSQFMLEGSVTGAYDATPPIGVGNPVWITYTADTQDGDPSPTRGRYDVSPAVIIDVTSLSVIQSMSGGYLWVELDSTPNVDRVFYKTQTDEFYFSIEFIFADGTLASDALPLTLYPPSPTSAGWDYNLSVFGDVTSYSRSLVPEPAMLPPLAAATLLLGRRRKVSHARGAAVAVAAVAGACASGTAGAASLTPLGSLGVEPDPGWTLNISEASGVSADGSTVAGWAGNESLEMEAFRWTSGGGMQGLGNLPSGPYSNALGISADGSTIVGWGTSGNASVFTLVAFRWTSGGGMVSLGDLPGGEFESVAFAVSGDGSTVVGWGTSASGYEAFLWTSGGGMQGLGDLGGGSFHSAATGISQDGSTIVGYSESSSGREAFRWTSTGGMQGLGDLSGGGFESWAHAVSDNGSVVVGRGRTAAGDRAFRWTSGGGMQELGDLTGDGSWLEAFAVSGNGSTVVGWGTTASGSEAFLWTADGGTERLWDVLLANGLNPTDDGWITLDIATGVSADGLTIVGSGTRILDASNTLYSQAFVAVIPEPAGWALLALAGVGLLAPRRRSRWRGPLASDTAE